MKWYKFASLSYDQDHLSEEAQFDYGEGLHPRQKTPRTKVTEGQFEKDWPGYSCHRRRDSARTSTTEGQLSETHDGYDHHTRTGQARDETQELQLRNEKWKSNVTPAFSPPERVWAAGVEDQHERITQAQLADFLSAKPGRHKPEDRVTEVQLYEDLKEGNPIRRIRP